jgi:hypothetical protein
MTKRDDNGFWSCSRTRRRKKPIRGNAALRKQSAPSVDEADHEKDQELAGFTPNMSNIDHAGATVRA